MANTPQLSTAANVLVGDSIQHPGRKWPVSEVLEIQDRGESIRFVIASRVNPGTTTGVTFPRNAPILQQVPDVEREYTHSSESVVHAEQRRMISAGYSVSLVGYDGARDVYAFGYWKD